jgi:glycogen synthase
MNIVYLTNQFPPNIWGGMGLATNFLTTHLSKEHRISVYTTNSGSLPFYEEKYNLKIYRPIRFLIRRLLQKKKANGHYTVYHNLVKIIDLFFNNLDSFSLIRKNYKKHEYQIVVVHDFMHSLAGLLCKLVLKIPIVFHVHFIEYTMTKWGKKKDPLKIIRFFEKSLAHHSSRIIVATEEMKNIMIKHRWDREKIKVIPLCNVNEELDKFEPHEVDLPAERKRIYNKWGLDVHDRIVLYVGRVVFLKGVFNLIRAFSIVVKENCNAKLVLVGEGNSSEVKGLIASLQLENSIVFGNRFLSFRELIPYYLLADICVFPSIQEPFGIVAIEAMTLGRPVILGHGFSRIFEGDKSDVSALYVDSYDPVDIAAKIVDLLANEEKRARIGSQAREHVKNNFIAGNVIHENAILYKSIIDLNEKADICRK